VPGGQRTSSGPTGLGQVAAAPPKTGAACHRVTRAEWGEAGEWGGQRANADANNSSGRVQTSLESTTTKTTAQQASGTRCGRPWTCLV
jgi:hypothetical protein